MLITLTIHVFSRLTLLEAYGSQVRAEEHSFVFMNVSSRLGYKGIAIFLSIQTGLSKECRP